VLEPFLEWQPRYCCACIEPASAPALLLRSAPTVAGHFKF
jgi:hypothetical protein